MNFAMYVCNEQNYQSCLERNSRFPHIGKTNLHIKTPKQYQFLEFSRTLKVYCSVVWNWNILEFSETIWKRAPIETFFLLLFWYKTRGFIYLIFIILVLRSLDYLYPLKQPPFHVPFRDGSFSALKSVMAPFFLKEIIGRKVRWFVIVSMFFSHF